MCARKRGVSVERRYLFALYKIVRPDDFGSSVIVRNCDGVGDGGGLQKIRRGEDAWSGLFGRIAYAEDVRDDVNFPELVL
jgi:hypothetical protein